MQNQERYDDGGYSGGNMERPGLKRLMADISSGKVDVIVVYKVDRLTRALTDFARIVEVLDARGASFVSVTQALNSTTSMGRLTLNVLLSFAQFEREVILSNPIYIGKVAHKGEEHEGEHPAIIDPELWASVQQRMADNRVSRGRTRNSDTASLLAGILRDGHGRRMTPSHAVKSGKRYRYYITHAGEIRTGDPQAWRMPAADAEAAVTGRLVRYFGDQREIASLAEPASPAASIGNNIRSTGVSRDNNIRSTQTSRANAGMRDATTRGSYSYQNGGRRGGARSNRPQARDAGGNIVEWNGSAWVPVR